MKSIWIIDDDQSIRWVFEKALARHRLPIATFINTQDALQALATELPSVVVSDIRLPGGQSANAGLELLHTLRRDYPSIPVIIMTAYSDLDSAVQAFQGGAFEYLPKPFDVDKAVDLIQRAVAENMREETVTDAAAAQAAEILGQAPAMQELFRAIGRLSQSNATVLISGESGSGKGLVAHALHRHSPRANAAFVAVNIAAVPRDLLETELFGYDRGAFTGGMGLRQGRFEQAEGGTLFLDEIGDMPVELQTRLLRVLSDGMFYRVGSSTPIKANVRVITATHQNLEERVQRGSFREDLYHRLNVIRLRLPPLRERAGDIPLLAQHFLQQSALQLQVEPKRLSASTLTALMALPLSGNVRQLENICHWLTVMAPAQVIELEDLPPELRLAHAQLTQGGEASSSSGNGVEQNLAAYGVPASDVWVLALERETERLLRERAPDVMDQLSRRFEAAVIRTTLIYTNRRRIDAAQRLGIGRNTITRKVQELGIEEAGD